MGYVQSATCGEASGGQAFKDDLTAVGQLIYIDGTCGDYLNQIRATWDNAAGNGNVVGNLWGNVAGDTSFEIKLDEGDYIVNVYGTGGDYVNTITFVTKNGHSYGPFGRKAGSVPFNIGELDVCGFFGYAGNYINQLGFWVPAQSPQDLVASGRNA